MQKISKNRNFLTLKISSIFLLIITGWAFSSNNLILNDTQNKYALGKTFQILSDKTSKLTIDDVLMTEYQSKFIQSTDDVPNFGYDNFSYWFKLSIINRSSNLLWYLYVNYPLLDDIYVYYVDNQAHLVGEAGKKHPNRIIQHQNYVIPVQLARETTINIYFKVKSVDTLVFPVALLTPNKMLETDHFDQWVNGMFYGIIIIMILYHCFLYITTKYRFYLTYVFFIFAYLLMQSQIDGYTMQLLWTKQAVFDSNYDFCLAIYSRLSNGL